MPHRHNIFSNNERKTEDYKKHINNFTACATCCCFIYFSFVPFSFLYYWLKTKASSHTHPFGVWCMGLRPTQVESFANISAVSLFGHNSRAPPSHFISSLMMSYQTQRLESLPNSLLIRHVVRYDYVESVLLPTKLQQLCATHTHTQYNTN